MRYWRAVHLLDHPSFHDEAAAIAFVEELVWGGTPTCPRCGRHDRIGSVLANPPRRVRGGLKRCGHCNRQFTVKIGTVFEGANLPFHKLLQAVWLLGAACANLPIVEVQAGLEISYATAWSLAHRLRDLLPVPNEERAAGWVLEPVMSKSGVVSRFQSVAMQHTGCGSLPAWTDHLRDLLTRKP